jgi:hypothetical protein
MKKAKITLAAIAIVAVVGGAFAFQAQKSIGLNYYVTTVQNAIPTLNIHAIFTSPVLAQTTYWYTTIRNTEATVSASFKISE